MAAAGRHQEIRRITHDRPSPAVQTLRRGNDVQGDPAACTRTRLTTRYRADYGSGPSGGTQDGQTVHSPTREDSDRLMPRMRCRCVV